MLPFSSSMKRNVAAETKEPLKDNSASTSTGMTLRTALLMGAWLGFSILLWLASSPLTVPSPRSGFLLTPEKLKESIQKAGQPLIGALVAHRGFHYANNDLKRPLENTLAAYERAWASGVRYAECDVTTTKDGEIVLSHDPTLERLALRPKEATKPIKNLDFNKNLVNIPLMDGSRVPKLIEVLQGAKRVGKDAKLLVEIKGDDAECARKVGALLAVNELGDHVAVVMSFSLVSIAEYTKVAVRRKSILSMLIMVKKSSGDGSIALNLGKIAELETLLKTNRLDGAYVEYDPIFLTDLKFVMLCQRLNIGVWGLSRDSVSVALLLVAKGVKFVNSDLGDEFFHY